MSESELEKASTVFNKELDAFIARKAKLEKIEDSSITFFKQL